MSTKVTVFLNVRRFDFSENPQIELKEISLEKNLDYITLKKEIRSICGLDDSDSKVLKLRNKEYALIPLSSLLQGNTAENPFILDVTKIQYITSKNSTSLLQDAYLDAVRQKLRNMESRVTEAELLVPQLQWHRQTHMEQTVNSMNYRVAFLNRRIDELMPPAWKSKMTQTIS